MEDLIYFVTQHSVTLPTFPHGVPKPVNTQYREMDQSKIAI
jgi:hypothetical protein